jgi:hypothetical protein
MIKVLKHIGGGKSIYISLEQYVDEYCKEAPEGWNQYIDNWVNEGMCISNKNEYESFLKKTNLKWFDYEKVNTLYQSLKNSQYNEMFEDDILRYIAYIYGLGYFNRINYYVDIQNPNLDSWLNIKNVFKPNRDKIPIDEGFSLKDLVTLKNGNNAIKHQLIFSSKW